MILEFTTTGRGLTIRRPLDDGVRRNNTNAYLVNLFKNMYKGQRCFIAGTGPSLNSIPSHLDERLCDEYILGVNLIMKAPQKFTHYLLGLVIAELHWADNFGLEEIVRALEATGKPMPLIRWFAHERELDIPGWYYTLCMSGAKWVDVEGSVFGGPGDALQQVGFGDSVVIPAIQIAAFMGFDPIYLLGCDGTNKGHAYGQDEDPVNERKKDQSRYLSCARACEKRLREAGRTLIDCTMSGALPVTKGDLEKVLWSAPNR